jgi:hypothetical protein
LPTPTAEPSARGNWSGNDRSVWRPSLHEMARRGELLPTPSAQSYGSNKGGAAGRTGKTRHSLESMAKNGLWPTPTVKGLHSAPRSSNPKEGTGLATAVRWATPTLNDSKNNGGPSQYTRRRARQESLNLNAQVGGALNPRWVEWLQGFPIGWVSCEPSETPSSPPAPRGPSLSCWNEPPPIADLWTEFRRWRALSEFPRC